MMKKIKVLVVDDSALMRKYIKRILEEDPRLEVVDAARDGEEAVEKNLALEPDVITLDLNMPKMDGLTALQYIMHTRPCPVVVVSSLTQRGALTTFEALELGAVDCIAKPEGTVSLGIEQIGEEIRRKVRAAARANIKNCLPETKKRRDSGVRAAARFPTISAADTAFEKIVVIGVSTGGPKTLSEILPRLPGDLSAPVVVVQHMPEKFTFHFASRLNEVCALRVKEAEDGEPLAKGVVLVARGGCHLKFEKKLGQKGLRVCLSEEPRDALYIPSVGVTLRSLRQFVSDDQIIGVMLTGMGDDGVEEMLEIKRGGGYTIAESEETAIVWGMPRELARRGGADVLAPAYEIPELIVDAVEGRSLGRTQPSD
ncbi:MAG TPA: chemotaxis response regulator protein-glutamate methylesterase [Peptococcaceae bacterium]|nr:chemotaxis response regulator protein-glutamate methylesterase [Peptococcaceae bacterium]